MLFYGETNVHSPLVSNVSYLCIHTGSDGGPWAREEEGGEEGAGRRGAQTEDGPGFSQQEVDRAQGESGAQAWGVWGQLLSYYHLKIVFFETIQAV